MKTMQDATGNLSRLQALIDASGYDAVIAVSPENVLYAGDVFVSTQIDIRDRLAFVVWAKGRAPAYVLCQVEEGYVRQESWIDDIRTYKEFVTSPIDVLADTLDEFGLANSLVGIETEYLGVQYHQMLVARLPGLRIEPCDGIFAQARMVKTQREREILTAAFRGTEKALLETYSNTRVGDTERDMAFRLCDGILRSGAQSVAFCHVNAGANTGFPHMDPSDNKVAAGDILKADAGGFYRRYYSNVGRTAKMGKLTDDDRSWWSRLRDIHREIIDMVRPGNTGAQLFDAAT
ncbi:MAG: M24 family metallopeptidase, partial [Hyphomicrobiaceae bacterium]